MKLKNCLTLIGIFFWFLCSSAFCDTTEFPPSEPDDSMILIGQANPALSGIEKVLLIVVPEEGKPEKDGLVWKELENKVRNKLEEAGIRTATRTGTNALSIPELRVYVETLKFADSDVYVYRSEITLAMESKLKDKNLYFKAEVWWSMPVMNAVSIAKMPETVAITIEKQAEEFTAAWAAANSYESKSNGAGEITIAPKKTEKPQTRSAEIGYKYVSSKNSKVFHKAECSSAKKINSENLVFYSSREEAIKAGKRPCKRCNP
jgi:hypothetical protein